jgi:hypothetical protein
MLYLSERVNKEIKRRARWSGFSPTSPLSSAQSAPYWPTCTTNGTPIAAISPKPPWPRSTPTVILEPSPPSESATDIEKSLESPPGEATLSSAPH